ncbi:MAG: hypothetical protein JWP66_797 [Naasia sp.]|nr:hypothetical protein [Naasia sp.]
MSVLRPYRFERELDRSIAQWLAWLPRWEPASARRRGELCAVCPRWADELGFPELPHGPLHALVTSTESLLIEHFLRNAAARFPELEHGGEWRVWLERGVVRITSKDGRDVDDHLDMQGTGETFAFTGTVTAGQAAAARIELVRVYFTLFNSAVARLSGQKSVVARAIGVYVEPKIQRMADELVAEVCGAA